MDPLSAVLVLAGLAARRAGHHPGGLLDLGHDDLLGGRIGGQVDGVGLDDRRRGIGRGDDGGGDILGVGGTLLTLILERRSELATLRLVGADRRQVRKMVVVEAGLIGLVSQDVADAALALALAVFGHAAHTVWLVLAVTTALKLAPEASVPTLQLRICGLVALTVQFGVAVLQLTPPLFGSVSVIVTLLAMP